MDYVKFSLLFILSHGISYTFAGAIALRISKDIYESKTRHCNFLRDMADKEESLHVSLFFLPAQILRGLLMAMVLFPLLNFLLDLPFVTKLVFFGSLMFVYTHISAASPFIDNIEGLVYFKKEYLQNKFFFKFQLEMVIYSIMFGILMSILTAFVL